MGEVNTMDSAPKNKSVKLHRHKRSSSRQEVIVVCLPVYSVSLEYDTDLEQHKDRKVDIDPWERTVLTCPQISLPLMTRDYLKRRGIDSSIWKCLRVIRKRDGLHTHTRWISDSTKSPQIYGGRECFVELSA
jgi:hypothetical protein